MNDRICDLKNGTLHSIVRHTGCLNNQLESQGQDYLKQTTSTPRD